MFSHRFFISSGIPSKQPYMVSGTEAIPLSSLECLKNQPHHFSFSCLTAQVHTCAPSSSLHPQLTCTHSPPQLGLTGFWSWCY